MFRWWGGRGETGPLIQLIGLCTRCTVLASVCLHWTRSGELHSTGIGSGHSSWPPTLQIFPFNFLHLASRPLSIAGFIYGFFTSVLLDLWPSDRPVPRLFATKPPGHRPLCSFAIRPPGHMASCHPAYWPSALPAIWPLAIRPSGYPALWSSVPLVIRPTGYPAPWPAFF